MIRLDRLDLLALGCPAKRSMSKSLIKGLSRMKLIVDTDKCQGSGECAKLCPMDAIVITAGKAVINLDKCDLDGICIPACPSQAIHFLEE